MKNREEGKDSGLLIAGSFLFLFVIFIFLLMYNPGTLSKFIAPWYSFQARTYARISPEVYGNEAKALTEIRDFLYAQEKNKTIGRVDASKTKALIAQNSPKTLLTSKAISFALALPVCLFLIYLTVKDRRRRFSTHEGIRPPQRSGAQGLINLLKPSLDPQVLQSLTEKPNIKNIRDAFASVRMKKNVPNNVPARMFAPFSEERLAILEVGKTKLYDRTKINKQNNTITSSEEESK